MPLNLSRRAPSSPGLRAIPSRALGGTADVPGDKSMSHRALILSALARGTSGIHGLLESDDVLRTGAAVGQLGASVKRQESGSWAVTGALWHTPQSIVDCGNSGTSARLLLGAAAGHALVATFTGDESLRRRPMNRITDPLQQMGASFDRPGFLPITLTGGPLKGIRYRSPLASAQVKSAILLAGLQCGDPVEVIERIPTRDSTERMLLHLGCEIETIDRRDGRHVRLGAERRLKGRHILIPGDPSSAAFAIVAALITRDSDIRLRCILDSPARNGLIVTLLEMGADIELTNRRTLGGVDVVDMRARSSPLRGVRVPAARAPSMIDEYPLLGVAASFAEGETIMEGLSELRFKESDRLAAMAEGLKACGVGAAASGDRLKISGSGKAPRGGASIATLGDHRIAMAFLVMGLGAKRPVSVDEACMIATSFPGFAEFMGKLGAEIEPC